MGWVTENGKDVWGIVNECGAIVAHGGTAQFTYVLNRVFLQFLVKKFGKSITLWCQIRTARSLLGPVVEYPAC